MPYVVSVSPDSTAVIWNGETLEPEWTAVLLSDGQAASFTAAGQLLFGNEEVIEEELVYIVEHEDGSFELLKPSEFEDFQSLH